MIEVAKRKGSRKEGKASTAFTDTGISNLRLVSKVTKQEGVNGIDLFALVYLLSKVLRRPHFGSPVWVSRQVGLMRHFDVV